MYVINISYKVIWFIYKMNHEYFKGYMYIHMN